MRGRHRDARLREIIRSAAIETLPEASHDLVEFGILAIIKESSDPMEKAFHELGHKRLIGTQHLHGSGWTLIRTHGVGSDLLAMSQVWRAGDDEQNFIVATKGAPGAIFDLCHFEGAERSQCNPRK